MSWSRITLAAAAGGAAFLLIAGAYYGMIAASLNLKPLSGGGPPRPGESIAWFAALLLAAVIAGALPARVLGASWGRSLLAALGAHVVAAALIFGLIRPRGVLRDALRYDALALLLGATLTVLGATIARNSATGGTLALVTGAAVVLAAASLVAPGHGLSIAALAWLVLPAIAARVTMTLTPYDEALHTVKRLMPTERRRLRSISPGSTLPRRSPQVSKR